jgi:hypothetical protein
MSFASLYSSLHCPPYKVHQSAAVNKRTIIMQETFI